MIFDNSNINVSNKMDILLWFLSPNHVFFKVFYPQYIKYSDISKSHLDQDNKVWLYSSCQVKLMIFKYIINEVFSSIKILILWSFFNIHFWVYWEMELENKFVLIKFVNSVSIPNPWSKSLGIQLNTYSEVPGMGSFTLL